MAIKGPPKPELEPERDDTDTSLRTERWAADRAAEKIREVEDDADHVIDVARARADAVLATARDEADRDPNPSAADDAVTNDRAQADEVVHAERAGADESLRKEREEAAYTLMALLPLQRVATDRSLLTERARSDAVTANRDDFLGMVSHDLSNLLAGIVLSTDLLAGKASETEEGHRTTLAAKRIQIYAARMKKLIDDLVDVASITSGKLAITAAPGDSRSLVEEALETFRLLAVEKGVSLESEIAEEGLAVAFDHDRILQVLANLIGNAIKFTPRGGAVVVGTIRAGNELRFSVSDSGSGIPEDLLEAVFERFWQVGENDRRGVGLGLYIARSIVQVHGGRIWAESRIGRGSTFHFTLPTEADNARRARPPAAHSAFS